MLTAKDYRLRAWNALNGNWGTVAITYLLVTVVLSFCGGLSAIGIGAILLFVLEGPIQYGFATQSLNVVRGKMVDVKDVMAAQHRFADSVIAYFITAIYTFLWSLLFIIPGIIAAYSYSLTYYVMLDNPMLSPDQARRESMRLMQGHKWELFCLHFSFIGWILLCALTFGILTFWVMPYMQAATAEFYDCLIPTRPTVEHVKPKAPDPFESDYVEVKEDNSENGAKPDEPFYVFEEERPRKEDNNDSYDTIKDDRK
ncbi:MAG: DUF975 family protein [Clostridiales bacterium]|nr:DUF975 family protein [Clostridiales bacterium]